MHPEPVVRARPAESTEMPRTATSLAKKAEAMGWTATCRSCAEEAADRGLATVTPISTTEEAS